MASDSDLIIFVLFLPSHISMSGELGVINFKALHFKLPELSPLCCVSRLCSTSRSVISFFQSGSSFAAETSNAQSAMQAPLVIVSIAASLNVRMCRTTPHSVSVSLSSVSSLTRGYFADNPSQSTFRRCDHESMNTVQSTVLDLRVEPTQ